MKINLVFLHKYYKKKPLMLLGSFIILMQIVFLIFSPYIIKFGPTSIYPDRSLLPPNSVNWFGTDISGMDIFSRVIYATRIDIGIALTAVLLSFIIGVPMGAIISYYENFFSEFFLRIIDIVQSFPIFILAVALVSATGQNTYNVMYVIGFLNVPIFVRIIRSQILSIKNKEYIEAAKCAGSSDLRIIFIHLIPNSLGTAWVQASASIGWAILVTAGISFIGAGVRMPIAEWGLMVSIGSQNMITGHWWVALFPGLAMMIAILGFGLFGEMLNDMIDPTYRT